jgi:hypothetical protein
VDIAIKDTTGWRLELKPSFERLHKLRIAAFKEVKKSGCCCRHSRVFPCAELSRRPLLSLCWSYKK